MGKSFIKKFLEGASTKRSMDFLTVVKIARHEFFLNHTKKVKNKTNLNFRNRD